MANVLNLPEHNLYANGKIIRLDNGEEILQRTPIEYTPGPGDQYHTVSRGELLDKIAWEYYKNLVPNAGKYYWVIADVNGILNPLDLSGLVGKSILIPNILTVKLQI